MQTGFLAGVDYAVIVVYLLGMGEHFYKGNVGHRTIEHGHGLTGPRVFREATLELSGFLALSQPEQTTSATA